MEQCGSSEQKGSAMKELTKGCEYCEKESDTKSLYDENGLKIAINPLCKEMSYEIIFEIPGIPLKAIKRLYMYINFCPVCGGKV
jgi:hypothetical protein